MPKKPAIDATLPDPVRGKAGSVYVPVPHRVQRALELLRPRRKRDAYRAGYSYVEVKARLMREFDIGETAAEGDLAKAYEVIRGEIAKTDYPSTIRLEMESLAKQARAAGDFGAASASLARLGKWSGMEGDADSLLSKLTDAALDAAIEAAVKERIANMTPEQIAEVRRVHDEKAGAK